MDISAIVAWFVANWASVLQILAAIYGLLALIVKLFPTIPDTGAWAVVLWVVKMLGKLTNRQVDDDAIRQAGK